MTNPMLALAIAQGEALIDRAMIARVTRARLLAGAPVVPRPRRTARTRV